jgi:radical SAM enzyme (TIGR01210 family)
MKIFLSHSSIHKPLLRELKRNLAPGLQEWLDERELEWGANLEFSIKDAVKNSDLFVIFLGQDALTSEWVMRELQWASEREQIENSIFVLPILMPGVKREQIPDTVSERLFLTLSDHEESSVKSLSDKINLRILHILIKRISRPEFLKFEDVSAITQSRLDNYISCYKKIEFIRNPRAKEQLIRILDTASKLTYVIVGAPRIYQHDSEILAGMNAGDIYRATHPFKANKKAHYVKSVQFQTYTKAQIQAANRGASIKRLYILPSESFDDLTESEKNHLYDISKETKIDSRIIYLSNIPNDDLGEDFVIFDNSLLGVAIPKRGEMLGSEYRYSIDSNADIIEKYKRYFDTLFNGASLLKDYLNSADIVPVPGFVSKIKNARQPAFILQNAVSVNGRETQRLMIVLRTSGCAYDQNNMGCAMCDFKRHAVNRDMINSDVLMEQLEYSLEQAIFSPDDVSQIDLLSLGSFLHNNEVPEEFRILAFQKFSTIKGLKKIVIESRSPYIQSKSLLSLKNLLREDQILEIGLGIESSDEFIRNNVLRKNLSNTEIRRVVDICAKTGVEFLTYLLIGSMTLTEDEALQDAINSANYIANLCNSKNVKFRVAFEPVFITHDTELEKMYLEGNYSLINLWRVIDVIKSVSHLGSIFVGLSDEGLSSNRISSGCPLCTDDVREAIERFNGSQSVKEFEGLICECQTTSFE